MTTLNLYLLTQDDNRGYDTYSDAVVAAESVEAAQQIHPSGHYGWGESIWGRTWANEPENVTAKLIGVAVDGIEPGVICSTFNGG